MNANPPDLQGDLDKLRQSAVSADPAAREGASARLRGLLEQEFETTFDATQEWAFDPDARLREVVCRSLMNRPEVTDEVRARRLIGRAELFLGDANPAVGTLATRTVLPYLLRLHPAVFPEWTRTWMAATDEAPRRDLAHVLAALVPKYPAEAVEALSELSADPRPVVRGAVVEAVTELARGNPGMRPQLQSRFPEILPG